MEQTTFADSRVQTVLREQVIAVRVDCTQMTEQCDALTARFGIVGFPSILFLDASGAPIPGVPPAQGYVSADELLSRLTPVVK